MRIGLSLLIVSCFILVSSAQTCAPYGNITEFYFPRSFQASNMSSCCWYALGAGTCCYNPTSNLVDSEYLSELGTTVGKIRDKVSTECYYNIWNLQCLFCSPQTANFVDLNRTPPITFLCLDLCEHTYSTCRGDLDALLESPQNVNDASSFCKQYFVEQELYVETVQPQDERPCFAGVSNVQWLVVDATGVCIQAQSANAIQISIVVLCLTLLVSLML